MGEATAALRTSGPIDTAIIGETVDLDVRVEGQLIVNDIALMKQAALDGLGLAFLPEDYFEPHLSSGKLVRVLSDWCPPFPGYHLYYPSRRQPSGAFALVVDALRYRE